MKNKLFLTTLLAIGFTAASQAQNTTTFVDVSTLGAGIVDSFAGGAIANGTEAKVISVDQRWTRDKVYLITQNTMIKSGVVLTIEPGTVVRFEKNVRAGVNSQNPADPGALVVARGARLIANGTAGFNFNSNNFSFIIFQNKIHLDLILIAVVINAP